MESGDAELNAAPKQHGALMNQQPTSSLPSIFEDGDVYDLVGNDVPYGLDFYVALAREAQGHLYIL